MAEAIIRVADTKGGVNVEIKLTPAADHDSAAYKLVEKFIEVAGLERIEADDQSAPRK
jgi:hypothetical protein